MNTERLIAIWARVQDVLQQPTRDPKMAAMVGAAIALLVGLIVIVGMLVLSPKKRRVRKVYRVWEPDDGSEEDDAPLAAAAGGDTAVAVTHDATPSAEVEAAVEGAATTEVSPSESSARGLAKRVAAAMGALTVPLIVVAALVFGYVATGTDAFCYQTCHSSARVDATLHKLDHSKKASCVDCHEDPSVSGVIGNVAGRGRMALAAAQKGKPQGDTGLVPTDACLRCHGKELRGVIRVEAAGIAMKHKEPLEAGMNCADCHERVGHAVKRSRPGVPMRTCIACHNDKVAPAACATCHLSDIAFSGRRNRELASDKGTRLGTGRFSYPPVTAGDNSCYGCHKVDEARCDKCHGLRMPHSQEFKDGTHAKMAAFEKKKMCYRCHDDRLCQKCHLPFKGAHLPDWEQRHQSAPWDSGCSCHARDKNQDVPICVFCHDNAPVRKIAPPRNQ